jgi:hypothetical protein
MKTARIVLAVLGSTAIWSAFFYFLSPGSFGILPASGGVNIAVNMVTSLIVVLVLRRLLVGPKRRKWWIPLASIPLGALVWGILTAVVFAWSSTMNSKVGMVDYRNLSRFPILAVFMAMTYDLIFTYPLAYLNQLLVGAIIAPNQSLDPTLTSGTPPAEQEPRLP